MSDNHARPIADLLREALALHGQGQLEAAMPLYIAVLAREPQQFDAMHLLGVAHLQRGNLPEAESLIGGALRINPRHAPAQSNYGVALRGLQRSGEALSAFDQAIAAQPESAENHYNRGLALMDLARFAEALPSLERAVALNPNHADAHQARSATLERLGQYEASITASDAALRLRPQDSATLYNRGKARYFLGHAAGAQADFRQAIALNPDFAEAHWALGESLLLTGDDVEGWREYEWRWLSRVPTGGGGSAMEPFARSFAMPWWEGEDLAGKTILLHAEQGYGDTLQLCRYVAEVAKRGARIVLEVQPPLKRLLAGMPGVSTLLARGDALPTADVHCPLMSLPRVLNMPSERLPRAVPYVTAPPALTASWAARIVGKRRPLVGLCWFGVRDAVKEQHRSIAPSLLNALAAVDADFASLQLALRPEDRAVPFVRDRVAQFDDLRDFADTAALIAALDVVVTVDTANAHLAGAMGKPVWIMLPTVAEWRWGITGSTTPWYPNARLFRQTRPGAWDAVIAGVGDELRKMR